MAKGLGVTFVRSSRLELTVHRDDDYTDESNDGRSVSRTVVTLEGVAVIWASSTKTYVTLSTMEAEDATLGERVKEALFTGKVLYFAGSELGGSCVRIFQDNPEAEALAEHRLGSARSEHIDV